MNMPDPTLSQDPVANVVDRLTTWKLRAKQAEQAIIDIREKAAQVANNGAEERDRFLGRQIILLCEKALVGFNRQTRG